MQDSAARCWVFDQEVDSPLTPFDDRAAALAHVVGQNIRQGRERWVVLSPQDVVPDRSNGTPAILPSGSTMSIGGRPDVNCARALEIAGALVHAANGTRRIVGELSATPVEDEVELVLLEGQDKEHAWRFRRDSSKALAIRIAKIAMHCITLGKEQTK